jgi:hypothetical protein
MTADTTADTIGIRIGEQSRRLAAPYCGGS